MNEIALGSLAAAVCLSSPAGGQETAELLWMCSMGAGSYGPSPHRRVIDAILPTLESVDLPDRFPTVPVSGLISSGFGWRIHPITGLESFHAGIDIPAPLGTPILSSMSGRVGSAGAAGNLGLQVTVESGDTRTIYGHMSAIAVAGEGWVEAGQTLGYVGSTGRSTGPHLHFTVHKWLEGSWTAIDPSDYLERPASGDRISLVHQCNSAFRVTSEE